MNAWKVILATMVIFGSGVITGALVGRIDHQHIRIPSAAKISNPSAPKNIPPWQLQRASFLKSMEKQLELTTNQQEHIERIMHSSAERTKPIWDQIAPQMQVELKKTQDEIRQELTPAQQKKYEELLRNRTRKDKDNPMSPDEHKRRQMLNDTNQAPVQVKP